MKLVLDEDGHAVLKKTDDGKVLPVFEYEDGTKKEFDAHATLEGLNKKLKDESDEKDRLFKRKEEFKTQLEAFKDIDPDKAKDALAKVKNLSDKKILDEKGVEAVKAEVRNDMKILHEEAIETLKKSHNADREEWQTKFTSQEGLIRNLVVDNLFANSEYFSGDNPKTIYPPSDASKIFGHHVDVKIDGGKVDVSMVGNDGKTLISKVEHGEPANFNEGIGLIIDKHPRKNEITRAGTGGGPGSDGNLEGKDGKKFKDMTSVEKIAHGLKKHQQKHTG
jgi:hypothetical protein